MEEINRKIITIDEAVELIPNGAHLTVSGFAHSLVPMAIIRELVRKKVGNFEFSSMGEAWAIDMLCGAGLIDKMRLSNYMFEGYGRCYNFSRVVESGQVEVEDYSHFGITSRLFAAALGIPFIPIKTMRGTDIFKISNFDKDKFEIINNPFAEGETTLVPALSPDIALIHASRADSQGNVQIFGSESIIDEQVRASKKVIVSVEEIVDREMIKINSKHTLIPGFLVDHIVEVPYGAHPCGMYKYYDFDREHIAKYWEMSKNADSFKIYLDEYVYDPEDHWAYLEKIGIKKLLDLRPDPTLGYSLKNRSDLYG